MAFLNQQITSYDRKKLRQTTTTVHTDDGRTLLECRDKNGAINITEIDSNGWGFIGDFKPDIQVGEPIPGLLVGSQDAAADLECLQLHKITHVLNVASQCHIPTFTDTIKYKMVRILDIPETYIPSFFPECFEFINEAMKENGRVLVHCNAGVSRAPSIVLGYLMCERSMPFDEAFALLKSKRPCIRPNDGFRNQLEEYSPE